MRHKDFVKKLEENPEYLEVEKNLKPLFDLADEVLSLRLQKGWSQSELARRAKTKQANISKLESGLANPTVKSLQKIGKALGVELKIRYGEEKSKKPKVYRVYIPIIIQETAWGKRGTVDLSWGRRINKVFKLEELTHERV
jgi:transcriptional regulator with XRE-family HTH domain